MKDDNFTSRQTAVDVNPYAPTAYTARPEDELQLSEPEIIRRSHLHREASIKSIGALYLIGVVPIILMATGMLLGGAPDMPLIGIVYITIGMVQFGVGIGLRRLHNWARIAGIVLSIIGLLAVPIGTLISGYFLYLLASKKGKLVCSEPYQAIIQQTPHINYKTSLLAWIVLVALVVILLALFVTALVST